MLDRTDDIAWPDIHLVASRREKHVPIYVLPRPVLRAEPRLPCGSFVRRYLTRKSRGHFLRPRQGPRGDYHVRTVLDEGFGCVLADPRCSTGDQHFLSSNMPQVTRRLDANHRCLNIMESVIEYLYDAKHTHVKESEEVRDRHTGCAAARQQSTQARLHRDSAAQCSSQRFTWLAHGRVFQVVRARQVAGGADCAR